MNVILLIIVVVLLLGGITATVIILTRKSSVRKGCGGTCKTDDDCDTSCPCDATTKTCTVKKPVKLFCGHSCDPSNQNAYCPTECPCTGGVCATPPPRVLSCGQHCSPSDSSARCPDTCHECIDGICAIPTQKCGDTCKIGDPTSICPVSCPCSNGVCTHLTKKCGDTCGPSDTCPSTCPCSNGICQIPTMQCGQSCDPTGDTNKCPDSCPCANTGPGSYSCHVPFQPSPNIPKGGVCNTPDTAHAKCVDGTSCVNNVCAQFLQCGATCDPQDSANICTPFTPVPGMNPPDDGKGPCCPCVTGADGKSRCTKPTLKTGDHCRMGCALRVDSYGAGCPDNEMCLADEYAGSGYTAGGYCTS